MTRSEVHTAIVVFARSPALERKRFGASRRRDLRLLEWLCARTLTTARSVGRPVFLATDGHDPAPPNVRVISQRGCTFEDRLLNALRAVRDRGFDRVVVVGTDTPGLTDRDLSAAVATDGAFVGPSFDGGFYCLALPAADIERLAGLPWGRPHLLKALLVRLDGPVLVGRRRTDLDGAPDLDHLACALRRVARLILGEAPGASARLHHALHPAPRPALTVRDVSPSLSPPGCGF